MHLVKLGNQTFFRDPDSREIALYNVENILEIRQVDKSKSPEDCFVVCLTLKDKREVYFLYSLKDNNLLLKLKGLLAHGE